MRYISTVFLCALAALSASCHAYDGTATYWYNYYQDVDAGLVGPGEWAEVERDDLMTRFGDDEQSLQRVLLYNPVGSTTRKPFSFFVIHGTWAAGAPDFFEDENTYFESIRSCVEQTACQLRAPVELVSYQWSGSNDHESRFRDGIALRHALDAYYGPVNGYTHAYALAHSHGCNVLNVALRELSFVFHTLYYIASPVVAKHESVYIPANFRNLYHMYSADDWIQSAGNIDTRVMRGSFLKRQYDPQKGRRVYNIRMRIDGRVPGHISIKKVASHAVELCQKVTGMYRHHINLVGNVVTKRKGVEPIIAIHDKISLSDALDRIITNPQSALIARHLKEELALSGQEEDRYNQYYDGHSIHKKNSVVTQFKKNIREVYEAIEEWTGMDAVGASESLLQDVMDT